MINGLELRNLADDAVRVARSCGADFADLLISWGRQLSVSIEANDVRLCEQHEPCGYSVRTFVGGGVGSSSGDGLPTRAQLAEHVAQAVSMAKLAGRDPDFVDLPGPAEPLAQESAMELFDPAIEAVSLADAVRLAHESIEQAVAIDPAVNLSGDASFASGTALLASSTGVTIESAATLGCLSLFAVVRDGDDVGSFADFTTGRRWADLQIEALAEQVARSARRYQHARPCPARTMTLLLGPMAGYALLGGLAAAASAESIRRKRSLLAGRQGQMIASAALSLADRPLEPRGIHSSAFDAEGSPRRPVVIVDRGVFAAPLTNHYNARLAGVVNTGHGTRRDGVSPTNLHVGLGSRAEAELIREVDDGVYLEAGSLSPDPASGDFSEVLDFAFKIDRGQLTYPLAGAMAAGNMADLLKHIDATSSDYRAEPGQVLPAVRIGQVQFSGGG